MNKVAVAVLLNWAAWVVNNANSSLCYPRIEPYRRLYNMPGEQRPWPARHDSAKVVDQLMERLMKIDSDIGLATALHYVTGMSNCQLSELLSVDRKKISARIGLGTAWIDGAYNGIEIAA